MPGGIFFVAYFQHIKFLKIIALYCQGSPLGDLRKNLQGLHEATLLGSTVKLAVCCRRQHGTAMYLRLSIG